MKDLLLFGFALFTGGFMVGALLTFHALDRQARRRFFRS